IATTRQFRGICVGTTHALERLKECAFFSRLARAQLVSAMGKTWVWRVFAMAQPLVSDALWAKIKPLLPPPKPRRLRFPGRKPLDPRKALTGIIFVLKSGIPWELLPQEMGCGSGMSCWNY